MVTRRAWSSFMESKDSAFARLYHEILHTLSSWPRKCYNLPKTYSAFNLSGSAEASFHEKPTTFEKFGWPNMARKLRENRNSTTITKDNNTCLAIHPLTCVSFFRCALTGSQFDADGALKEWWSNRTSAEFKRRAKCFEDQYGNITDKEANMTVRRFQFILYC